MALALRFDRQTYTFAKPEQPTYTSPNPVCDDFKCLLDEVIGEGHGYCANQRYRSQQSLPANERYSHSNSSFNDLSFYMDLCVKEQCTKVEISQITVYHGDNYCNGILYDYRSTFSNGNTEIHGPPAHVYNSGYYSSWPYQVSKIIMQEGEYLAEIRTRQGEITDQITFITNQRRVSFGGNGGSGEDMSAPPDLSRRIVAFVGTSKGVLEKLGAISVSINWEEVGHLVLLRTLVEKNRASVVLQDSDTALDEDNAVVQRLITNTDGDLFKRIVSFLGYGMKVSE